VTLLPYRGAIAAPLRRDRLQELMEFRMALEHFALERLLDRATDETVRVLRAQVTATRDAIAAGDLRRAVEEDLSMHRSLVAFAGNSLLERAYEGVLSQVRLYIHVTSSKYERAEDLADEHDALIDAIARGDGPLARQLLDAHIMHGFTEALGENAPETEKKPARN
jgi:DNA-binding GntR family transcriptional regulator